MKMYQVAEIKGKHMAAYMIGFQTEQGMTAWLNGKRAFENERTYSITAWELNAEGYGYVALEGYGYKSNI